MTVSGGTSADIPAITAKTAADFQLSQEESGFSLIIQDVSKDSEHVIQLNLEKVCFTNLWWQKTNKQPPPKKPNKQTKKITGVLWTHASGLEQGMWLFTRNIEPCEA